MSESFSDILAEGGKKNSLGRVNDVITLVLADKSRLEELFETISHEDAWVRMRAIDAFEKICREHPEWITPFIIRIQDELSSSPQASIQWHIAQIYRQAELTESQKEKAIDWLENLLHSPHVDWIVSANGMDTLAHFVRNKDTSKAKIIKAAETQLNHRSNAVVKRAQKMLAEFS